MTWKYFSYEGDPMLACPCCGQRGMDDLFMQKMDKIREVVGPIVVLSGFRCQNYNEKISDTGRDGPHTFGRALDVRAGSRLKYLIRQEAMRLRMTRFGVDRRMMHLDDLRKEDGFDQEVEWTY